MVQCVKGLGEVKGCCCGSEWGLFFVKACGDFMGNSVKCSGGGSMSYEPMLVVFGGEGSG